MTSLPQLTSAGENILWVIIFILSFLFSFLGKLTSSYLIIRLIGLIINSILKKKLKYAQCVKLAMYSLTVPYLIKTILGILNVNIRYFFIIYYGIGLLYLFLGMKYIETTTKSNETDNAIN